MHGCGFIVREETLEVGLAGERQHSCFGNRFKIQRSFDRDERRHDLRRRHRFIVEADADHAARRYRGFHLDSEEAEECETLALRNQVGAVEQSIGKPGEQLHDRHAGIARPRVCPFGCVRRNARNQFINEIVEIPVVECWRTNRHGSTP